MKKSRTGLKVILIILLVVLAVVGSAVGFVFSKLNKLSYEPKNSAAPAVVSAEQQSAGAAIIKDSEIEAIESSAAPEGDVFKDKNVINILFLGSDLRIEGTSDRGRADSIMLCSLNKNDGSVKLTSFERGISVSFDMWPYDDILTHTFHWGGAELTTDIVREYFLLDIEGYAHVDFETFAKVIDAVGGVDIDLTEKEALGLNRIGSGGSAWTETPMHTGVNHLNGYDALQYCRLRAIDSDWHRVERQRNTIQAVMNKVKDMNLVELNKLADTILPLIHTDLSKAQITSLMLSAPKFLNAKIGQLTVPYHTPGEHGVFCDFQVESERVKDFIYK